jgi:hypothetical protein
MTDNIVTRLQCIYDKDGCGQCTFCLAKAEIERLRAAGDALAEGIRTGHWDDALDAWEATRRG